RVDLNAVFGSTRNSGTPHKIRTCEPLAHGGKPLPCGKPMVEVRRGVLIAVIRRPIPRIECVECLASCGDSGGYNLRRRCGDWRATSINCGTGPDSTGTASP